MKSKLVLSAVVHSIIIGILANSFLLIRACPSVLFALVPLFLLACIFSGASWVKAPTSRSCLHGTILLYAFCIALAISILYHIPLAIWTIPADYMTLVWSGAVCVGVLFVVFWIGILCVYLTSAQLGFRLRLKGLLCGLIPVYNLIVLSAILKTVSEECIFEMEKDQQNKQRKEQQICATKYPILLVHGVFFRDTRLLNYWGRIPKELEMNGAKIFYGNQPSALSIADSAAVLKERILQILAETGAEKVNIIAHSKGGLDCRYAISEFGIGDYVASLTTVNTPHRGCLFAEQLLNTIPQKIQDKIARAYNVTLTALGDETPDFMAAVTDLTAEACIERNKLLTFPEGIFAQSIGSVMGHPRKGQFPLNLCYPYVKQYDGDNDGLVGENSFEWGEKYTLLRCKGKRGISHCDIIDLGQENLPDFDVRAFYTDLVSDLRNRGF